MTTLYTTDHEWLRIEGDVATIGVTDYAQSQLGDVVFVEDPTYFLALDIFRHHGLQVVGIEVDDDGLSIDALEAALAEHRPAFVYVIPAFQNPTGVTMAPHRRARLLELAERHDFLVVADEVYQLLRYAGSDVPPMAASVDTGRVLSLGTFSKILAPGLRLGWIQAGPSLIDRLVAAPDHAVEITTDDCHRVQRP